MSLLTPPGVGAIAVIRLEGDGADRLMKRLFRVRGGVITEFQPDRVLYGELRDGDELIDEVLAVPAAAPRAARSKRLPRCHRFDICAHGGIRVAERIALALTSAGATFVNRDEAFRGAWPASNTVEREVWEALARARTRRGVRFLLRQRTALPGALRRIARQATQDSDAAVAALGALLDQAHRGRRLIGGVTVAILGPANAGKSTLANHLVGAHRSVISLRPGTTLDWVTHETALAGVPVTLIDTPGHGPPEPGGKDGHAVGGLNEVAAARARERSATADLHLRVFDGSRPPPPADRGRPAQRILSVLVLNKSDLGSAWGRSQIEAQHCDATVSISAAHGTNTDRLVAQIKRILDLEWSDEDFIGLFTPRQTRLARELVGARRAPSLSEAIVTSLIGDGT